MVGSHICLFSKRVSLLCYVVPGTVYLNDYYVRRTNVYNYKKKTQKPSEAFLEYTALHVSEICKAYKSLINSEMNLTEMATEYLQTC